MSNIWMEAAWFVVHSKLAFAGLTRATEAQADIGTRLLVRRVAHRFEYYLDHFLRAVETLESVSFTAFRFSFDPLHDEGPVPRDLQLKDPLLARPCFDALISAEVSLADAVACVLNNPEPWTPQPLCTNPMATFVHAKWVLDLLGEPLEAQQPAWSPVSLPHDAQVWSYVERSITPSREVWQASSKLGA